MTVQQEEAIATAAGQVLELARERHWRSGQRLVDDTQVICLQAEVEKRAHCTRTQLPAELRDLLKGGEDGTQYKKTIGLCELMMALYHTAHPNAA